MRARRGSSRRSQSGRVRAPRPAPRKHPGLATGTFRSPRNRLRLSSTIERVVSGRYVLGAADEVPVAELVLLLASAACVALGFASIDRAELFPARLLAIITLPTVLAVRSSLRPSPAARRGTRAPLWVGAVAVIAAALVQAGGGPASPLALVAFFAIGAGSLKAGPSRTLPWALVTTLVVCVPSWLGWAPAASPVAQALFFLALVICASFPGRVIESERRAHGATRAELRRFKEETGQLNVETSVALPAIRGEEYGYEERDRDLRTISRELQADMDRACNLLVDGTGAMCACVYRPDGQLQSNRLVAVAKAGDTAGLLPDVGMRDGIFGAAYKGRSPVSLRSLRDDDPRLAHRLSCSTIGATIALPLVDGDRRFGVIVLDWKTEDGFSDETRMLAGSIADMVSRLIARAVDLTSTREGMRENHAFYEACREVSKHVRIDAISDAVVNSAGRFVALDACALAIADHDNNTLKVIAEEGFGLTGPLPKMSLDASEGLLVQSVHHRTMIDRPDLVGNSRPPLLFGRSHGTTRDLSSLLVLPIYPPGEGSVVAQGALVVARRSGSAFDCEDGERLEVLLHQVGAALSNGTLFAEHETRGITDGMTGLPNHRRFQEVLAGKIASSQRTGLKLSLLLMDIDKFKSVNDNYGHPMGDEVIKRLAKCLSELVREGTDLGARYGGEEFCLLLDDTDASGARRVAERLRESFKAEVFAFNEGGRPTTFGCTVSIGVACFADDATSASVLVERADQALYWSKESGRDRVTLYSAMGDEPTMIDGVVPVFDDDPSG